MKFSQWASAPSIWEATGDTDDMWDTPQLAALRRVTDERRLRTVAAKASGRAVSRAAAEHTLATRSKNIRADRCIRVLLYHLGCCE